MRSYLTPAAVLAAGVYVLLSGCQGLVKTDEVVRADEPRRPVAFESPEVARRFEAASGANRAQQVGGTLVGPAPFYLYGRRQFLGENAKFNDAAARCDTDRDGVITAREVDGLARTPGGD
ncbi:MAG: hypothetical protein K2X87_26790 [Gemmataceae bacterium]|nr:hypothetical protein [Gemmataceae bacterium]